MTGGGSREAVASQAIEWALRDKPFETGYLQQSVPAAPDREACAAVLETLQGDRWVRPVDDAWYPGVRALLLGSFNFPTPDTDGCVRVVGTARDHVVASDGADRAAIEAALTPLDDYMVGINGPNMLRAGFGHAYQEWLLGSVVEPGLRTLPAVEPPQAEGEPWTVGEVDAEYCVLRER